MKTWGDLVITHNTQGQTLNVICRLNKNQAANDSFTLCTIESTAPTPQIIPLVYPSTYAVTALQGLPIKSFSLSIRITGSGANTGTPVVIESPILLHYYVEARQGLTFDSGNTTLGLNGVGTVDEVEVDGDFSGGSALLNVSSDIPGGTIMVHTSPGLTIPETLGRQIRRVVMPFPPDGRLWRFQIASTYPFQVYGLKVRVLPIGVYLDGTQNEYWYTTPLAPGTGQ
jgi:hypothetical protein